MSPRHHRNNQRRLLPRSRQLLRRHVDQHPRRLGRVRSRSPKRRQPGRHHKNRQLPKSHPPQRHDDPQCRKGSRPHRRRRGGFNLQTQRQNRQGRHRHPRPDHSTRYFRLTYRCQRPQDLQRRPLLHKLRPTHIRQDPHLSNHWIRNRTSGHTIHQRRR